MTKRTPTRAEVAEFLATGPWESKNCTAIMWALAGKADVVPVWQLVDEAMPKATENHVMSTVNHLRTKLSDTPFGVERVTGYRLVRTSKANTENEGV